MFTSNGKPKHIVGRTRFAHRSLTRTPPITIMVTMFTSNGNYSDRGPCRYATVPVCAKSCASAKVTL